MEVNSTRFPSGIPALADWLHGKGDCDTTSRSLGCMYLVQFHEVQNSLSVTGWETGFLKPKSLKYGSNAVLFMDAHFARSKPVYRS